MMKRLFLILTVAIAWLGLAAIETVAQSSGLEVMVLKDHGIVDPLGTIKFEFSLTNTSSEPITVYIVRVTNDLPNESWGSAICTDFCYAPFVSEPDPVTIPANSTYKPSSSEYPYLNIYAGTDAESDAHVTLTFKVGQFGAPVSKEFSASLGTSSIDVASSLNQGVAFPNPAVSSITIPVNSEIVAGNNVDIEVYTSAGELVEGLSSDYLPGSGTLALDVSSLTEGAYFYRTTAGDAVGSGSFIVQR